MNATLLTALAAALGSLVGAAASIQLLLAGFEDDSHAAAAKDGFDFVSADVRKLDLAIEQWNMAMLGRVVIAKHFVKLGADALNLFTGGLVSRG